MVCAVVAGPGGGGPRGGGGAAGGRGGGGLGGGPAGATAGVAGGLAGAWRTSVCAVAQVATQCSWFLGWAWIRPSVPSWANTRTGIQRSVTVHCLLRKDYNCWRGGGSGRKKSAG